MERRNTYLKDYSHYTGATLYTKLLDEWQESKRILEEQGDVKIYYLDDLKRKDVTA